jgi:hypothetical protein
MRRKLGEHRGNGEGIRPCPHPGRLDRRRGDPAPEREGEARTGEEKPGTSRLKMEDRIVPPPSMVVIESRQGRMDQGPTAELRTRYEDLCSTHDVGFRPGLTCRLRHANRHHPAD